MHAHTDTHPPPVSFTLDYLASLPHLQVRKELEVNGIEFYPQKEFDEDLEDKTENDKIRVGACPSHRCPPGCPWDVYHIVLLSLHLLLPYHTPCLSLPDPD